MEGSGLASLGCGPQTWYPHGPGERDDGGGAGGQVWSGPHVHSHLPALNRLAFDSNQSPGCQGRATRKHGGQRSSCSLPGLGTNKIGAWVQNQRKL